MKNGKVGQGLPGGGSEVPENYKKPVYLVPEGKGGRLMGNERKHRSRGIVLVAALAIGLFACTESPEDLSQSLKQTTNYEQAAHIAARVRRLDADGIPIFLAVLNRDVANRFSVLEYGKDNVCLMHLREMARQGIHDPAEVPVLLRVMDRQMAIGDTIVPAETIRIITGLDVGYDERFVHSYEEKDEPARQQMLERWRRYSHRSEPLYPRSPSR